MVSEKKNNYAKACNKVLMEHATNPQKFKEARATKTQRYITTKTFGAFDADICIETVNKGDRK